MAEQSAITAFFASVAKRAHIAQQDAAMQRDEFDLRDIHKRSLSDGFVHAATDLHQPVADDASLAGGIAPVIAADDDDLVAVAEQQPIISDDDAPLVQPIEVAEQQPVVSDDDAPMVQPIAVEEQEPVVSDDDAIDLMAHNMPFYDACVHSGANDHTLAFVQ